MLQSDQEKKRQIGFIGLGKMGSGMVQKLLAQGYPVHVFDQSPSLICEAEAKGASGAASLTVLVQKLNVPRVLWLMIPQGAPVERALGELLPVLSKGDIVIDGGNSYYKDSLRRAQRLKEREIYFMDVGTSGGIGGRENGYCFMAGGESTAYQCIEPFLAALACREGYRRVGASGAGHFVKMVHNAIGYGMLQAYGEGFELLQTADFDLNLEDITHLWNRGSVVRSWILELSEKMFREDPRLDSLKPVIEDSGEGRWAVQEAIERGISVPVTALALLERFRSRTPESFSAKVIAGLRRQFGGHAVSKK